MSNAILPVFPGLTFSVKKTSDWGHTAESLTPTGKSVRIARQAMPRWQFELVYSVLSRQQRYPFAAMVPVAEALDDQANLIANDFNALAGFFNARKGMWDSWLFEDPRDCAIAVGQIGIGNGVNVAFQITRDMGEFTENTQNINGTPVQAPDWAPTTAKVLTNLVVPTPTAILGQQGPIRTGWQSLGWPVYYACTTAGTTGSVEPNWRQNAPLIGQTIQDGTVVWTCQGPPLIVYFSTDAGVTLTSQAPANYSLGPTGILTFTSAPALNTIIYVTTSFWFRCHFIQDTSEFELFQTNFYSLSKLQFESLIL